MDCIIQTILHRSFSRVISGLLQKDFAIKSFYLQIAAFRITAYTAQLEISNQVRGFIYLFIDFPLK